MVEYARAQLGRPYWWGTFGQTAGASLLAAKRKQYPGYYQAADFESQLGHKVHDCVGLIKGYRWCDGPEDGTPAYIGAQDVAVAGLYRQCGAKGDILSMPDEPGICVFMGNMGHVGVYIGGGRVIEAMATPTAWWIRGCRAGAGLSGESRIGLITVIILRLPGNLTALPAQAPGQGPVTSTGWRCRY